MYFWKRLNEEVVAAFIWMGHAMNPPAVSSKSRYAMRSTPRSRSERATSKSSRTSCDEVVAPNDFYVLGVHVTHAYGLCGATLRLVADCMTRLEHQSATATELDDAQQCEMCTDGEVAGTLRRRAEIPTSPLVRVSPVLIDGTNVKCVRYLSLLFPICTHGVAKLRPNYAADWNDCNHIAASERKC